VALSKHAGNFGRGSDFNAALEEGVFPERSPHRTAVVIVVSDGNMEVIEGDRAPELYLEAARDFDGPTLRDRVHAAAMARFRNRNLPTLGMTHGDLRTYVVPVAVGAKEDGHYVLKDLAGLPGTRQVVKLGDTLLGALTRTLMAPVDADAPPWNFHAVHVFSDARVPAGGETSLDLRLPLESVETRILVLGNHPGFTVGLTGAGGRKLGEEEGVRVFGTLNRHRVIAVTPRNIPNHALVITNLGEEDASFQAVVYCSFDLETALNLGTGEEGLEAGESLPVEFGVADRSRGRTAEDPWILEHAFAVLHLMDASGETVEKRFPFSGLMKATQNREILLDARTPAGTFLVSASIHLLGADGSPILDVPPVTRQTRVKPGVPAVQVDFQAGRSYLGHALAIRGELTSGYPPAGTVVLAIDHVPAMGGEGSTLETELAWDPAEKAYLGQVAFKRAGRYDIRERKAEDFKILRGARGSIELEARGIALLDEEGGPLENVLFAPAGQDGPFPPLTFFVSADLRPGETGKLKLEARPHKSSAGAEFVLESGGMLDLTAENPQAKVTLRLKTEEGARPAGEVGIFEIEGTLGGDPVRRKAPISATLRPLKEKTWADFLRRKDVLAGGIALFTVAALATLLLVTIPRYRDEHLLHEREDGGWDEGALLTEMRAGANPRNAFGTTEIKKALAFRLRGRKGLGHTQVWAKPLKPFVQFYRNGEQASDWTPLEHGDRLRLKGARYGHYYRYFAGPLTPEQYESLQPDPDRPVPEPPEEEIPGEAELVIEIPEGEAVPDSFETAVEGPATAMEEIAAPHGFMGDEDEEPGGEQPLETVVAETDEQDAAKSAMAELETIFESASPAAPAKGEFETVDDEKPLSFTDIFGEDDEPAASSTEETVIEGASAGPEQDAIFEKYFDAGEEDDGTDIIPETQVVEEDAGDGTEIVGEGELADAFRLDPDGIFSEGDITKLLEEAGEVDGDILIDVPVGEEESAGTGLEDVFSVGGEGEGEEELNPELAETQEVEVARAPEEEALFAESEGDGTEMISEPEQEIEPPEGGTEVVSEWAGGETEAGGLMARDDGTEMIPEEDAGFQEKGDGTETIPGDDEGLLAEGDGTEIVADFIREESTEEVEGELEVEDEVLTDEEGDEDVSGILSGLFSDEEDEGGGEGLSEDSTEMHTEIDGEEEEAEEAEDDDGVE